MAAEHGLTSPLFTPRTLKNITESISESSIGYKKDKISKTAKEQEVRPEKSLFKARKVLIETFNLLRSTIEVTHSSQSLSSNDLVLVLKLSDLVNLIHFSFIEFINDLHKNILFC